MPKRVIIGFPIKMGSPIIILILRHTNKSSISPALFEDKASTAPLWAADLWIQCQINLNEVKPIASNHTVWAIILEVKIN